jgi:hypothetical protein
VNTIDISGLESYIKFWDEAAIESKTKIET